MYLDIYTIAIDTFTHTHKAVIPINTKGRYDSITPFWEIFNPLFDIFSNYFDAFNIYYTQNYCRIRFAAIYLHCQRETRGFDEGLNREKSSRRV